MKILITGVFGFIGMHVARLLLERSEEVLGINNLYDYYPVQPKPTQHYQLSPQIPPQAQVLTRFTTLVITKLRICCFLSKPLRKN